MALGKTALASKAGSVAIGSGSIADVGNTVSVGTTTARRRIVNVANGVGAHDVVTVAQLNAAVAAAIAPVAMAPPGDDSQSAIEDIRREVSALRALVQRQQQELAELKAGMTTAALGE